MRAFPEKIGSSFYIAHMCSSMFIKWSLIEKVPLWWESVENQIGSWPILKHLFPEQSSRSPWAKILYVIFENLLFLSKCSHFLFRKSHIYTTRSSRKMLDKNPRFWNTVHTFSPPLHHMTTSVHARLCIIVLEVVFGIRGCPRGGERNRKKVIDYLVCTIRIYRLVMNLPLMIKVDSFLILTWNWG